MLQEGWPTYLKQHCFPFISCKSDLDEDPSLSCSIELAKHFISNRSHLSILHFDTVSRILSKTTNKEVCSMTMASLIDNFMMILAYVCPFASDFKDMKKI